MATLNPMKTAVNCFRAAHAANKGPGFRCKASASDPTVGELYLYDAIGADFFGGIGAKDVVAGIDQLQKDGCTSLMVYVNSPGGDVFEGIAIYNAIERFKGKKTVCVDGLAASAASFIAMAGDEIRTAFNAMWMIHNPWGVAIGNMHDMRKTADSLEKIGQTSVEIYTRRTKQSAEDIQKMMDAETWMSANEALEKGFTDKVTPDDNEDEEDDPDEDEMECGTKDLPASAVAVMAKFKKIPKSLAPSAQDMISSMERRLMSIKRASPQK